MSVIGDMIRAGVDPELIERVHDEIVAAAKQSTSPERTARQERNARYYAKKSSEKRLNASYSDVSDGIKTPETASREEYNTTRAQTVIPVGISNDIPPIEINNPQLPTVVTPPKSKSPSPKEILSEVLTPETAADVVAHRKALRKPLTPRAARELAKSLSASGDAERAAATMIERGWQGYRADWVGGSPNARAGPSQGGGWAKQLVKLEQNAREQPTESGGTVEAIPWLSERKDEGRRADDAHDGGVSRNPVELLVGNSFRRM
jgi:hypothetical protein